MPFFWYHRNPASCRISHGSRLQKPEPCKPWYFGLPIGRTGTRYVTGTGPKPHLDILMVDVDNYNVHHRSLPSIYHHYHRLSSHNIHHEHSQMRPMVLVYKNLQKTGWFDWFLYVGQSIFQHHFVRIWVCTTQWKLVFGLSKAALIVKISGNWDV